MTGEEARRFDAACLSSDSSLARSPKTHSLSASMARSGSMGIGRLTAIAQRCGQRLERLS